MNVMMTVKNKYSDNLYCFLAQTTLSNNEKNNYKGYIPYEVWIFWVFYQDPL